MPLTRADLLSRVLFRNADLLVLDKPAGLSVHYGTKTTEHLEQYLPLLADAGADPPRLAHRLDKDTSGCLVLACHAESAAALAKLFLRRQVAKTYWAVVLGGPPAETGTIDLPLEKVAIPGCSKVVVTPAGKTALTGWRLLGRGGGLSWLELTPRTGRMHQLRAHCAAMGFPILGDPIYGADMPPPVPLHLHARAVAFPWEGGTVSAEAPVPGHMLRTMAMLEG